jgi:hypothetical protein
LREYVRLDEIPYFTGIPKTTVERHAGVSFSVNHLNHKVRVAKRADVDQWIESGLSSCADDATIEKLKRRRARPVGGGSTPELESMDAEALAAYKRSMTS